MPYAQAHVKIDNNGNIFLISYKTLVASIDKDGWIQCRGLYSRTTIRHISAFASEYTPFDYYTFKRLYLDKIIMNMYSGEVVPL